VTSIQVSDDQESVSLADYFPGYPRGFYKTVLADPPWAFQTRSGPRVPARGKQPYPVMSVQEIAALPVAELCEPNAVLFLWMTWPTLQDALWVITRWGFVYKTCAFCWTKANNRQLDMFQDDLEGTIGTGYWTRSNSEACLLATRGHPKRLDASVRQAIIAPRRQHSRKPEVVHGRIEQLVAGPYLELFARRRHAGWDAWGNETDLTYGGRHGGETDTGAVRSL
jgi:N6-adenosine-specific RNA methylase IME4